MNQAIADAPIYSIVMILYLALMFVIGLVAERRTRTAEDFWVSGRKLGAGVLTGTFTSTFISSFTMIGIAGAAYSVGWAQWSTAIGTWLGPLIMVLTMQYFVKFMGYTVPDILEARYGAPARPVAAFLSGLGLIAYTGVQMYAMGTILTLVLGWPTHIAMIVTSMVMIVYTVAGGFTAVAWTDCVQAVMLVVGLYVTAFIALSKVGGLGQLNAALTNIDVNYVDPYGTFKSPMTLVATAIAYGLGNPSQPAYLARAFAAKDTRSIKLALANGTFFNVWGILCGVIIGMTTRVLFGPGITPADAVFPYLVTHLLPPVFGALLIASIMAAIMSTADSYLVAFGTSIAVDFYQRYVRPQASDKQLMSITRISLAVAGVFALLLALYFPGSILTVGAYVFGGMAAALFVPLYVGFFWRRANTVGAVASMLSGSIALVAFTRYNIGIHPIIMGVLFSAIAYVVLSLLTPPLPDSFVDAFMERIGRQKSKVDSKVESTVTT